MRSTKRKDSEQASSIYSNYLNRSNTNSFISEVYSRRQTDPLKSQKASKYKASKAKITINEIDELEVAMDLLFGEQQEQTN